MYHSLVAASLSVLVLLGACTSKAPTPKAQAANADAPKPGVSKTPVMTLPEHVKKKTIRMISTRAGRSVDVFVVVSKAPTEEIVTWANQNGAILETACNQPLPKSIQRLRCQKGTIWASVIEPLQHLTHFDAGHTPIAVGWLGALGAKPTLKTLNLSDTKLRDVHLKDLNALTSLQSLDVSSNSELTGGGLVWLPKSLKALNLEGTTLKPSFGATIVKFPALVYLNVSWTGLKDKTIEAWGALKHLKVLEAKSPSWSIKALDTLHTIKSLEVVNTGYQGVWFDVHRYPLTDKHLAMIGKMTNLTSLSLTHTKITDDGMKHLAGLTKLKRLVLDRTAITDHGMQHIKGHTHLEYVSVYKTKAITGKTLEYLQPLKKLNTLILGGTQVKDADLARLASWKHVTYLDLCNAENITEASLEKHNFKHLSDAISLSCKDEDHNCDHD